MKKQKGVGGLVGKGWRREGGGRSKIKVSVEVVCLYLCLIAIEYSVWRVKELGRDRHSSSNPSLYPPLSSLIRVYTSRIIFRLSATGQRHSLFSSGTSSNLYARHHPPFRCPLNSQYICIYGSLGDI